MKFNVIDVSFDFDNSTLEPLSNEDKQAYIKDTLGEWEVDDEEELIDKISDVMGYCIKKIRYQ